MSGYELLVVVSCFFAALFVLALWTIPHSSEQDNETSINQLRQIENQHDHPCHGSE